MSIINPWVFYAIGAIDNLGAAIRVALTVAAFFIGVTTVYYAVTWELGDLLDELWNDKTKKAAKTTFIVLAILCLIAAVLPTEETMYQMLVAKYVTYDAVDALGEGLKTVVDYIVAAAKELMA